MKYSELTKIIKADVFSLQDLRLRGLHAYPYQLTEWVKKGDLIKLKNGLYLFAQRRENVKIEHIAFLLYQPSYISLEWALSKYGLIPEMVYNPTSITAKATRVYQNKLGSFSYRSIKSELFYGYKRIDDGGQVHLIAEPEKALFDFIYLHTAQIDDEADLEELRLNQFTLAELDFRKIKKYFQASGIKKIMRIYKLLLSYADIKPSQRKLSV